MLETCEGQLCSTKSSVWLWDHISWILFCLTGKNLLRIWRWWKTWKEVIIQQNSWFWVGKHKVSRTKILGFQRADFNQLKEIVGKVLWVDRLKDKGLQESRQFLKHIVFETQQETSLTQQKHKNGQRPMQLHKELLGCLKKIKGKPTGNGRKNK